MSDLPLTGITVLDFSRFLPAPYCSMVLGDFGANVIRIEQPKEVEKQEKVFKRDTLSNEEKEHIRQQEFFTRNKRSLALDLRSESGRAAVQRLLPKADVIIHDYRPGVMENIGIGYEELHKKFPRLIYCAVSLGGQTGPYRDLPGHDPIALALSGALTRLGETSAPHIPGLPVGDLTTGMHAVMGILLALRARDINNTGQLVDIAMTDAAMGLTSSVMQRFLIDGHPPPHHWKGGNVGLWKTKDNQFICATDLEPNYWQKFCVAIERTDLIPLQFDASQADYLHAELENIFQQKTRDEWFALLKNVGTQIAPVYTLSEALQDPHALARGTVQKLQTKTEKTITHIGPTIKLSETPGTIRELGHLVGADSASVLKEFGFSDKEISDLIP